jgi:secretion/DNA translocation related TadE-like protein
MATAELAVAVPAVGLLLGTVVAVTQAGVAEVEVVDAARAGARAAARGDDLAHVQTVATQAASGGQRGGAAVRVATSGAWVRVTVSRQVRLVLRHGPAVRVSATAAALREAGSATVLVLAVALVAVVLATFVASLSAVAVARHRAASAADLGALAAADILAGRATGSPCTAAGRVVQAGGAVLTGCRTRGRVAEVEVTLRPGGAPGRLGRVSARARAGPAPADVGQELW